MGRQGSLASANSNLVLHASHTRGYLSSANVGKETALYYAMQLWPGAVNFPDFFAQQTIDWWTSQIQGLNGQIPLDGLWIDMHEPSNFCTGDICVLPGAYHTYL